MGQANVILWEPGETLASIEERVIHGTISYCDGNKKRAAEMLGVSYQTILNKLEGYHVRDKAMNHERRINEQIMKNKCTVADGSLPEKIGKIFGKHA